MVTKYMNTQPRLKIVHSLQRMLPFKDTALKMKQEILYLSKFDNDANSVYHHTDSKKKISRNEACHFCREEKARAQHGAMRHIKCNMK